MLSMNVRELRGAIPHLRQTLATEHEVVLISNGEAIARILPVAPKRKLESLAWLRAQMPYSAIPSEQLVREDRDSRDS
jgi:antitoxin (DNA-binding transcriptional repressor) of toxin-antitoxin stability system